MSNQPRRESPYICTKQAPWTPARGIPAQHPDAEYLRDEYDDSADHDDYEVRHCPNCNLTFKIPLAN